MVTAHRNDEGPAPTPSLAADRPTDAVHAALLRAHRARWRAEAAAEAFRASLAAGRIDATAPSPEGARLFEARRLLEHRLDELRAATALARLGDTDAPDNDERPPNTGAATASPTLVSRGHEA